MEKKITDIGILCFWIALVTELIVVIIDKSAYTNPYEGWTFRITFLLFLTKAVTTKYKRKDMAVIAVCGLIAVISYFVNGKDESVRAAVFVVACKDIDIRKMLKMTLLITGAGAVILFILSATGIFGVFSLTENFGRGSTSAGSIETRYCFGMGHPNAFQTMLFMMTSLVLYLYSDKMRGSHFIMLAALNVIAYIFTDSNSGMLVTFFLIIGVAVLKYFNTLKYNKAVYVLGGLLFIAVVAFSAYGAFIGNGSSGSIMFKLDKILNGRFEYSHKIEAAHLENWKLFASPLNDEFFDQGFIRMFYWYGIIPALLYIFANIYLIWQSYAKKDYTIMVIVVAYGVLSIMEAHLISVYLLRNYLLIWLGYYWYRAFEGENVFEGYIWQIKGFLKGEAHEIS